QFQVEGNCQRRPTRVLALPKKVVFQRNVGIANARDVSRNSSAPTHDREQRRLDANFEVVKDTVVEFKVRSVLFQIGKCGPLQQVKLVAELKMKVVLRRGVGIVSYEGLLCMDQRNCHDEHSRGKE